MHQRQVLVFDAYGTLFDVHAPVAALAAEIGPDARELSQLWRTKQLEYTWIHASTGRYRSFRQLTSESLAYAIDRIGGVSPDIRERLLEAYRTLAAYPEVAEVMAALKSRGARLGILSNGDPDMLDDAVAAAGLSGVFDAVISVAAANTYKPDRKVYALATEAFGVEPSAVSFQSSNRWDIAGAKAFGFQTMWINRSALPDEYPDLPPDTVAADLRALLDSAA